MCQQEDSWPQPALKANSCNAIERRLCTHVLLEAATHHPGAPKWDSIPSRKLASGNSKRPACKKGCQMPEICDQ